MKIKNKSPSFKKNQTKQTTKNKIIVKPKNRKSYVSKI